MGKQEEEREREGGQRKPTRQGVYVCESGEGGGQRKQVNKRKKQRGVNLANTQR